MRSFREGTDYSDGIDVVALVEEIRDSKYYIPELSFVAELNGKIVGHFLFSRFPLSRTKTGGHIENDSIAMLAPVAVHADYLHEHIGLTMLSMGIRRVREYGFKGIPLKEPRCMMCQEVYEGALNDISGYVVYDMYYNA